MSEKQTHTYEMTTQDRELVAALVAHQKRLGLNDSAFASEHLSYSATVWSRVVSGEYSTMVKAPETVLRRLRDDLHAIEDGRRHAERYAAAGWVDHPDAVEVLRSVRQCRSKPLANANRLVAYLAPTGGGKSWLCARLARDGARVVEARQSWQSSYGACLRDICRTFGIGHDRHDTNDSMEDELVRRLGGKRQVLAIDEGEFFSARSLNLVKLMLNKSPLVIVLCAVPEAYERWNKANTHEALQIRRRTHAVCQLAPFDGQLAREFLHGCKLEDGAPEAVCEFCNAFGAFDFLAQLRMELEDEEKVDRKLVWKAGNRLRACMRLPHLVDGRKG